MAFPGCWLGNTVAQGALHPVGLAIGDAVELFDLILIELVELTLLHSKNSFGTTHPHPPSVILQNRQHFITEESLPGRVRCKLSSFSDSSLQPGAAWRI